MEMNFSLRGYVIPAFFLMAVMTIHSGVSLLKKKSEADTEAAQ